MTTPIANVDNTTLNNVTVNLDIDDIADPALRKAAFQYIYAEMQTIINAYNAFVGAGGIATGNLADLSVTTAKLADLAVTTGKITDLAIVTAKINDLAVTAGKIALGTITSTQIADLSIATGDLADALITTAKLADLNVTTAKYADASVTLAKMAAASVGTSQLVDISVTGAKIAPATITADKFVAGALNNDTQNGLLITALTSNLAKNTLYNTIEGMFRGNTVKIVANGDSITFGKIPNTSSQDPTNYPATLQTILRANYANNNITVVNNGVSGRQTDTALANFDSEVLSLSPNLVILMYGINDARDFEGGTPDTVTITEYKANMKGMIQKCKDANVEVLVLTPTPTNESATSNNKELMLYNNACIEISEANNVPYINISEGFNELFFNGVIDPYVFMPDNIHFTDYSHLANLLLPKLLYNSKTQLINGSTVVPIANSPFVLTDSTNIFVDGVVNTYYLKTSGSGGTYLRFNFYVDRPNLNFVLDTIKYNYGGIATITIDGASYVIDAYSPEFYSYNVEYVLIENMSVGYHTFELLSSNVAKGSSVDPTLVGNFHIKNFRFRDNKIYESTIYNVSSTPTNGTIEKYKRVSDGTVRFNSLQAVVNGAIFSDVASTKLRTGKTLVFEVDISMAASRNGIVWFANPAKGASNYSNFNCGYSVYVADSGVINLFKFGLNNGFSVLTTGTPASYNFAISHKIRVEHTSVGVITVFLDGVQMLTYTDTMYKSGYFGVLANKVNSFEITRYEYCYI